MIGLGILVFAACTSGGGGSTDTPTLPPPSPSPSPSQSRTTPTPTPSQTGPLTTGPNVRPGEKPPILNAIARQHTSIGAMAFAQYYIQVIDWSIATTDTYLIHKISKPSCAACKRWIHDIGSLAAQHAHIRGGRYTIGEVRLTSGHWPFQYDYVIDVKYVQAPDVIVYPGSPPSPDNPKAVNKGSYVFVSWINGQWQVVEEETDS